MKASDYLNSVRRTIAPNHTPATTRLGLRGETGEVCDLIKKWTGHGVKEDREKILKELGDCTWYAAAKLIESPITEEERADLLEGPSKFPTILNERDLIHFAETAQDTGIAFANSFALPKISYYHLFDTATLFMVTIKSLAHRFGYTLAEVFAANSAKLRARYPDGFSTAASLAKADEHPAPSIAEAVSTHCRRENPSLVGYDANGSPVEG